MTDLAGRLLLGLGLSLAIGGLAYWRGSLSAGGVLGAVLVGTTVFGLGGWVWGGTLVAFFASSSLLSHFQAGRKAVFAEKFAKGSRRDLGQVLANGGVAALLALLVGLLGKGSPVYPLLAFAFFGALATVNADTWATELGVLSRHTPRLMTTGRPVVPRDVRRRYRGGHTGRRRRVDLHRRRGLRPGPGRSHADRPAIGCSAIGC